MQFRTLFISGLFFIPALAEYQFFNFTTASTKLDATCVAVLNQAVDCDPSVQWAGWGRYEEDATLQTLCTTNCNNGLTRWQKRVAGACTQRFNDGKGNAILPSLWVERLVENYGIICQQNGAKFCNAVLRDGFGVDPNNQSKTKSTVATLTCDDCFIKQIQTRLQMPLSSNPDLASTFTSLTSACKKTGFAVTPIATTTSWIISTSVSGGPAPTSTECVGTKYTIKSGDNCNTIAAAQGISTGSLLDANGLQSYCNKFPTSGTLCIPTSQKCKTRTIKAGDTCAKVADESKVTWAQIVSWNPDFGRDCHRIADYAGFVMCVSNPGGNWANPNPDPTTTPVSKTFPPFIGTDASLLPSATLGGSINGSDIWSYNFAPGSRLDCQIYANVSDVGPSASCDTVAKGYGVTTADLVAWNPSLNTSCVFDSKLTYCVQPTILHVANVTESCTVEDIPLFAKTCDQFLALWGLDYETFEAFNPGIGSKCDKYKPGNSYCVMANHYRQSGIVSNCNKWEMANVTNHLQDPCGIIEEKHGLSHARFVAWNPMVGQDCTGLQRFNDYCVSIPNFRPTYTTRPPLPTGPFTNPLGDYWGPPPTSVKAAAAARITSAS